MTKDVWFLHILKGILVKFLLDLDNLLFNSLDDIILLRTLGDLGLILFFLFNILRHIL